MRAIVIGGGITGLTAAFRLADEGRRAGVALDLTILEAEGRPGGHATTIRDGGFVVEAGPNGFLHRPREPEVLELAGELGIENRLIEALPDSRRRYVLRRGRLGRVPTSPSTLLASDLVSLRGKLRLALEPWIPPARDDREESVFEFVRRRIGSEAAETLVDAAVAGISAGDSRTLSAPRMFPGMIQLEREHGSLVRGMIARRREGRARLLSFEGGIATLIDALAARLGPALSNGTPVRELARAGDRWRVVLEGGATLTGDQVLLALPAWRVASIVRGFDPALAVTLDEIPFAGIAMVALAYRASELRLLDGYGYLVARAEGLDTLGVLWESAVFAGRAPTGMALLRVMLGGVRRPEVADLEERDLIERARTELERVMGVRAQPVRAWVRRWPRAIAQYQLGHGRIVAAARARVARHPGLELCGTSYDGVSFSSAVRSGSAAARRAIASVASTV